MSELPKKARPLQVEAKDTLAKLRDTETELLLQELVTGLTFAQLAHFSEMRGQPEDANRQRDAAVEAYQAVLRFLPQTAPTETQKRRIEADLAELKSKLNTLGVPLA